MAQDNNENWVIHPKYKTIGYFTNLPIGIDKELTDEELVRAYSKVNAKEPSLDVDKIMASEPFKKCNSELKKGFIKAKREEKRKEMAAVTRDQVWQPRVPLSKNKMKRKWKKAEKIKAKSEWFERQIREKDEENKSLKIEFYRLRKQFCSKYI